MPRNNPLPHDLIIALHNIGFTNAEIAFIICRTETGVHNHTCRLDYARPLGRYQVDRDKELRIRLSNTLRMLYEQEQ